MNYISYLNIVDFLDIEKGDVLLVSSDIKKILKNSKKKSEKFEINDFIDTLIEKVGINGTILFPTYNWDFCKGKIFDYNNTPSMTGALGKRALERSDFRRTKHPIYSFAVYGKDSDYLYSLENIDAFGVDSPFEYLYRSNAKNLMIDVEYQNSFTFVHYVEQCLNVNYRYNKSFTSLYIDEFGKSILKSYSMYVRNLELETETSVNALEEEFRRHNIVKETIINDILFRVLNLSETFEIIEYDIKNNNARKISKFRGQ